MRCASGLSTDGSKAIEQIWRCQHAQLTARRCRVHETARDRAVRLNADLAGEHDALEPVPERMHRNVAIASGGRTPISGLWQVQENRSP